MHWLLDPIKDHYVDFTGRATRQQYWMFVLLSIVVSIVLAIIDTVVGTMGALQGLFQLAILLPSIAIAARRLHDIGKSGWWQLIVLVPLVGIIALIVMLALKGTSGPNKYDSASGMEPATDIPPAMPGSTPEQPQGQMAQAAPEQPEQQQ